MARHEDGNGEVCTGGAWLFVVCCIFLKENQRGGQDGYTWFEEIDGGRRRNLKVGARLIN